MSGKRYLIYKATYTTLTGASSEEKIEVTASTINAGFRRATDLALKRIPKGWEIVSIEFWEAY